MNTVDVIWCGDCPFFHEDSISVIQSCLHTDAPFKIQVKEDDIPPKECPLRKETTLIQIAGTFCHENFDGKLQPV